MSNSEVTAMTIDDFPNAPRPYRPERPVMVMIDGDEIANVITIKPAAFTMSRREIASGLRDLIAGWIEKNATA
jgi:hypothetical protein